MQEFLALHADTPGSIPSIPHALPSHTLPRIISECRDRNIHEHCWVWPKKKGGGGRHMIPAMFKLDQAIMKPSLTDSLFYWGSSYHHNPCSSFPFLCIHTTKWKPGYVSKSKKPPAFFTIIEYLAFNFAKEHYTSLERNGTHFPR